MLLLGIVIAGSALAAVWLAFEASTYRGPKVALLTRYQPGHESVILDRRGERIADLSRPFGTQLDIKGEIGEIRLKK